uniref:Carbohydrate sulfotransferase n=1 Tax=Cacopsylla melanoneura TaxID=428564 RepID=A0A8D8TB78_9HEMI
MILRKYRPQAANKSNSRRATFEEFVLYLLDTFRSEESPPGLDMHWAPIVTFCTPCLVNFNVILKFETLQVTLQLLFIIPIVTFCTPCRAWSISMLFSSLKHCR